MNEPRRSTRIRAKRDEPASTDLPSSAGPSKRRRIRRNAVAEENTSALHKTRKLKKGTGALTGALQHLPLDILYEVFGYLAPLELLALSRSTKELRVVLLNRCARAVWLNALRALRIPGAFGAEYGESLPACPPNVPEPAYASLMLESICSLCGVHTSRSTLFMTIRKRCCVDCFGMKQNFVPSKSLLTSLGTKYAAIVEELLAPITPPQKSDFGRVHKGTWYRADEVKTVTSFVKAHVGDRDAMSEFAASRRAALAAYQLVADSAAGYEDWAVNAARAIRNTRSSELKDARETRRDAILAHICEAGYDDVAALLRPKWTWPTHRNIPRKRTRDRFFDEKAFVTAPRPLTDRVWEAHKDEVLDDMLTFRHVVPVQRRLQRLVDLYKAHPARDASAPAIESYRLDMARPAEIYVLYPDVQDVIHAPMPGRLDAPDPALDGADAIFGTALDDFFSLESRDARIKRRIRTLTRLLPPFNIALAPSFGLLEGVHAAHAEVEKQWTENQELYTDAGYADVLTELRAYVAELEARHVRMADRHRLTLAATMFRCSRCDDTISATQAALHQCLTIRAGRRDARFFLWEGALDMLPWNEDDVLKYEEGASDVAAGLVAQSGRDPRTATLIEVEQANVRFRCVHTKCKKMYPLGWSFANAVQHALKKPDHLEKLVLTSGLVETA